MDLVYIHPTPLLNSSLIHPRYLAPTSCLPFFFFLFRRNYFVADVLILWLLKSFLPLLF